MTATLGETNFNFPGQVGDVYHGKVGDVYTIGHDAGDLLAVIRTDRVSAFDVILPGEIPFKGQVLNQMSAALLDSTGAIAPNWLLGTPPDPNASVGYKADPFKIEMIARGVLLGTAWRGYEDGMRDLCGNRLPEGMVEFQAFDTPLLTPTTKAYAGHDENITPAQIIAEGLATPAEYAEMAHLALSLFAHGQAMALDRGLLLADTKYEFGRLASGQIAVSRIVVTDEIHTPDSSRYFPLDEYDAYASGRTTQRPKQLSKEFVREWLRARNFKGDPGKDPPPLPEAFRAEVSARYIGLYERMLGRPFEPAHETSQADLLDRIYENIKNSLAGLS